LNGFTGARIVLTVLQAKPEMSGATSLVTAFNQSTRKFAVKLGAGELPATPKDEHMKRLRVAGGVVGIKKQEPRDWMAPKSMNLCKVLLLRQG
jgi:hypothetical protein